MSKLCFACSQTVPDSAVNYFLAAASWSTTNYCGNTRTTSYYSQLIGNGEASLCPACLVKTRDLVQKAIKKDLGNCLKMLGISLVVMLVSWGIFKGTMSGLMHGLAILALIICGICVFSALLALILHKKKLPDADISVSYHLAQAVRSGKLSRSNKSSSVIFAVFNDPAQYAKALEGSKIHGFLKNNQKLFKGVYIPYIFDPME